MIWPVWDAQVITDENIKKATLVSALQDHTLMWYVKYLTDHPNEGIAALQDVLNKEFGWPKSETQSIIGFKEITTLPDETRGTWTKV